MSQPKHRRGWRSLEAIRAEPRPHLILAMPEPVGAGFAGQPTPGFIVPRRGNTDSPGRDRPQPGHTGRRQSATIPKPSSTALRAHGSKASPSAPDADAIAESIALTFGADDPPPPGNAPAPHTPEGPQFRAGFSPDNEVPK